MVKRVEIPVALTIFALALACASPSTSTVAATDAGVVSLDASVDGELIADAVTDAKRPDLFCEARAKLAIDAGVQLALCDDFQNGAWLPAWKLLKLGTGALSVTQGSLIAPFALEARALAVQDRASLMHAVDVNKFAELAFQVRVPSAGITSNVSILTLTLRRDTVDEIVLDATTNPGRVTASLFHREGKKPTEQTEISTFAFDTFVQVSAALPPIGAGQPLHVVVKGDLRAVSLYVAEPGDTPSFEIGVQAPSAGSTVVVDNVTLEYR
jgi:hypothetical protein